MKIKILPEDLGIDKPDSIEANGPKKILYKQYVSLFKKSIKRLTNLTDNTEDAGDESLDENGVHFFLLLNHRFPDKDKVDMPYIILGTPKGDWKTFMKTSLKKNKKMVARGFAKLKQEEGKPKLELTIQQGMAKSKNIKKLLDKYLFKYVAPEITFPMGDEKDNTLTDKDIQEASSGGNEASPQFPTIGDDKITPAVKTFLEEVFKKDRKVPLKVEKMKKFQQKIEVAIYKWFDKIGQALGLTDYLNLDEIKDHDLNKSNDENIQKIIRQYENYLKHLSALDKIDLEPDTTSKLIKHNNSNIISIIQQDGNLVNKTTDPILQEAYVKGLWAKVNTSIREKTLAGVANDAADLKALKELREEIAKQFPDIVNLKKAKEADPKPPTFDAKWDNVEGLTKAGELSSFISPSGRAFKSIIELIKNLKSATGTEKFASLKQVNQQINEWLKNHSKDSDFDQAKQVAALRGFQKDFLLPNSPGKVSKLEIEGNVKNKLDTKFKDFDKHNSWTEPSFKKLYKVFEEFNKNPSKELLQHLNRLIEEWLKDNPKDKQRYIFLRSLQEDIKGILKDEVSDTFSSDSTELFEGATAGSTASSEKAKDIRDAKVSDRARRLAELLKLGTASKSDQLFGAVAKWLADSIDNKLEEEYDSACQLIHDGKSSSLMADILSVFGAANLQSKYLLDRLNDFTHPLAPLAMKLGVLGKDKLIDSIVGQTILDSFIPGLSDAINATVSREEPTDAMNEVLKVLTAKQIDSIITDSPKEGYEKAIHLKLTSLGTFKAQVIQRKEILELKENPPENPKKSSYQDKLKTANKNYLGSMVNRLKEEHLGAEEGVFSKLGNKVLGRVNPDKLIEEVLAWADEATPEEREAIVNDKSADSFMKKLEEMTNPLKPTGFKESHFKYLKKRLEMLIQSNKKDITDKGKKATDNFFDELESLAEQQGERNFIHKRANKDIVFENFKSIIKLDNGNPQLALIKRFAPEELEKWEAERKKTLEENKGDKKKIEEQKEEFEKKFEGILDGVVVGNLTDAMKKADLDTDQRIAIEEAIYSNGARGFIYQELCDLATGLPHYDLGTTVLELLEKVETDSVEFDTIKKDKKLLAALKKRILGFMESEDNTAKWNTICKILGIKPADIKLDKEAATKFEESRTDDGRHKFLSPDELEKKKLELKGRETDADFWAAKIVKEYRTTNNEQHLLMLFYKAQQKGVTGKAILDQLDSVDPATKTHLLNDTSDHAKPLFETLEKGEKIKAKDIMADTVASVGVFNQNSHWLKIRNVFRTTDEEEVKELVKVMSADEMLESFFDLKALEPLKKLVAEKKAAMDALEKGTLQEEEVLAINQKIQACFNKFDISKDTMLELDAMMGPKHALEVKKLIRFKVGDKDNLKAGSEAFQILVKAGVPEEDIPLLGADLKAISNIEIAKQSETGKQWSSMSSRMGQRDIAEADYLTTAWGNKEALQTLGTLSPEESKAEKLQMLESIEAAEEILEDAIEKFEERKAQFDEKLKDFIATLMAAIIAGISIASGAGAAMGIVQLMWAMFTPLVKNLINQVVKRAAEGDRGDAIGFKENLSEWFFNSLADEAGVAMGFIGANLAFALDVKAIGVLTPSGAKDSGWTAWDNILKSPVIKTAKGYIGNSFENMGRSFVELQTKKTKGASATDAVKELENYGKKTITQMGTGYLKSLAMTTFTTGANELATALGWDAAKWKNTGMAGNNVKNVTENNPKGEAFDSSDAKFIDMAGFNESKAEQGNFVAFVNNLGMFQASPKLYDGTAATSDLKDPLDFIQIPAVAMKNLSDPKYLITVVNNFVWGGSEFKGEGIGISDIIGGSVDSALNSLKTITPKDEKADAEKEVKDETIEKEKIIAKLENELKEEVIKQLELKKASILENMNSFEDKKIPNFPKLIIDIIQAWQPLEKGKEIMHLWENMDYNTASSSPEVLHQNAQKSLGLNDNQYKVFSDKILGKDKPNNVKKIMSIYFAMQDEIAPILSNHKFVNAYEGFGDKFTIGKEITGSVDLQIPIDKKLSELSLSDLSAEWEKCQKAIDEPTKYSLDSLGQNMESAKKKSFQNFVDLQKNLGKSEEQILDNYFMNLQHIWDMLNYDNFGTYLGQHLLDSQEKARELEVIYNEYLDKYVEL